MVAKGFTQREGIDFNEVFSPVVKHRSIRLLLAITAKWDLELEHMDVRTAFLHGNLEEKIYMHQPEGFVTKRKEDQVCYLKKSLYGLKQSARQWNKRFDDFMMKKYFKRSKYDQCVYFKHVTNTMVIYLLLYVDDILIACPDLNEIMKLKSHFKLEFDMKDLGPTRVILGMEIKRDRTRRLVHLSQKGYVTRVLGKFGMLDAKAVSTPLAPHFKLTRDQAPEPDEEKEYMNTVPYASVVGSIMYAMICTRPDLAYAVSLVSRFMANPGKSHWQALKWIMRYLKGTIELGLIYGGVNTGEEAVTGYIDSDYAGSIDTRKSLTGYIFTIFGTAMSWKATLQPVVALSTTEQSI